MGALDRALLEVSGFRGRKPVNIISSRYERDLSMLWLGRVITFELVELNAGRIIVRVGADPYTISGRS